MTGVDLQDNGRGGTGDRGYGRFAHGILPQCVVKQWGRSWQEKWKVKKGSLPRSSSIITELSIKPFILCLYKLMD